MKVEKNYTVNGRVILDTGKTFMGLKVFTDAEDRDEVLYLVTQELEMKGIIRMEADCNQNYGFISGWELEDVKS